jgi:DNA modification methylase
MTNEELKILNELQKGIKVEKDLNLENLVNYSPKSDFPIHRWFKYREGYSIDLISSIIKDSDSKILDPFCGCGSTLIASKIKNKDAIGIDINPISVFVSKVKVENYSKEDLNNIKVYFKSILNSNSLKKIETPKLKIIDKAFHPEILDQLLRLKWRIDKIEDEKSREFIFLAFISVIESLSNTFKEGNGLKYRFTKRTPKGYIRIPLDQWYEENLPKNKIDYVNKTLEDKLNLMINDVNTSSFSSSKIEVKRGDAQKISNYVQRDSVSLTVFSPPYCNCFDYYEIFKLELWLGGFVRSYNELRCERKLAIRSNTNADLSKPVENYDQLETIVNLINGQDIWNKNIPSLIRGYFTDMDKTLQEIFKVTKNQGRCIIIVGNSAYGGILVPTDLLLAKIAEARGFEIEKIVVARHLTTSSQQKKKLEGVKDYLRESLVCLKKN